jgi:hypothetical protein
MNTMPSHRNHSFRTGVSAVGLLVALTSALVVTGPLQAADAQQASNSSSGKVKPPPLPNGSAHVRVKAGMSDEDWEKAYKETGRPPFSPKSVKKAGGNVERE